jgi:hypothetical protein
MWKWVRQERTEEGSMKIGDLVREYVGGPIMRIVCFLDECRVAVCQFLRSGALKRIAVVSLIAACIGISTALGHPPEEPPSHLRVGVHNGGPTINDEAPVVRFSLEDEGSGVPPPPLKVPCRPSTFLDDEALPLQFALEDEGQWVPAHQMTSAWRTCTFVDNEILPLQDR